MSEPTQPRRRPGRPTKYRAEYAERVTDFCMLGATNEDLAKRFGVDVTTLERWIARHEEFRGAIRKGREEADEAVSRSLYRRAIGYRHKAVKIAADSKGGEHIVEYTERYPPDTASMIFWLKNRRPDLWRDKQHLDVNATVKSAPGRLQESERATMLREFLAKSSN